MQACWQYIETSTFSFQKIFAKKYTIDSIQKRNYYNIAKIKQEKLFKCQDLQIYSIVEYIEQDIKVDNIRTFAIYCRDDKHFIKYSNKSSIYKFTNIAFQLIIEKIYTI